METARFSKGRKVSQVVSTTTLHGRLCISGPYAMSVLELLGLHVEIRLGLPTGMHTASTNHAHVDHDPQPRHVYWCDDHTPRASVGIGKLLLPSLGYRRYSDVCVFKGLLLLPEYSGGSLSSMAGSSSDERGSAIQAIGPDDNLYVWNEYNDFS